MAPFLVCKTRILVFSTFSSVSSVPFPFHRFSQQYLNYCYGLICISPISPPNSYVDVLYPVSQNMILFGDCRCNYTEVGWVPNPIWLMALKKGNLETGTHTQGERHIKVKLQWCCRSQGRPMITSKPPETRGETWKRFSLTVLRRNQPSRHLDIGFIASRTFV